MHDEWFFGCKTHVMTTQIIYLLTANIIILYRDEGSYTLSYTYDKFLATSHHYHGKNRKKN